MTRRSAPLLCLIGGLLAAALLVIDAIREPGPAAQAWLAAWLFWIGLGVGALFLILVHALTGGRWGYALRPPLLDMIATLPLLALFLVPILVGARAIFPWARAGGEGWLAFPFFAGRAIVYVAIWSVLALLAWRGPMSRPLAWPALIVLFLTASLAALDWIMSLEPRWTSTIFGMLVTAGWVLGALAAAMLLAPARGLPIDAPTRDDQARLLLALALLWAYLAAVQLIVIWESDLAAEIPWYLRRSAGGWKSIGILVAAAQFAVPFLLLMWRPVRRSPRAVTIIAAAMLAGHLADTWWLTVPDFSRGFGWQAPVAVIAIGGCVVFVIARGYGFGAWLPLRSSHGRR